MLAAVAFTVDKFTSKKSVSDFEFTAPDEEAPKTESKKEIKKTLKKVLTKNHAQTTLIQ